MFHPWDLSEQEAVALQTELAKRVLVADRLPHRIQNVAGVDVAYADDAGRAFAAIAVINLENKQLEQMVSAEERIRFPYFPGLLSFRELPALAAALEKLPSKPDLMICDGQGIAHPRRFGLACHLGVLYDVPTIGCAKTRLTGEAEVPGLARGSRAPLICEGETVGAVLRTRDGVKPLYVSPGHRISIRTACDWILDLSWQYRIPEPIRMADQLVNKMKRESR